MNTDVIVIGSGQAGVPLAARLAEAGREVIIVEAGQLGGTCINVGTHQNDGRQRPSRSRGPRGGSARRSHR